MSGISTGILTNARPLTAEQIKELEKRVFETKETIAYLNEQGKLCFAGPNGPEVLKELAWHDAYELSESGGILSKKTYRKNGLKSFYLKETYHKQSQDDTWECSSIEASNFELANGYTLTTSDNLIFEIKEY